MIEGGAKPAWSAAERAARESYGRLVALLAYQWRDPAAAEDALADAFAAALSHWPRDGVPAAPDAWLLTAARRRLLEKARHQRLTQDPAVLALFDEEPAAEAPPAIPDRRLALLFVCAHPALPENIRTPLMLQLVLGLDAAAIAQAYLVSPTTMAQRLVRAKAKIRDTGLRFEEPDADDLPERLHSVLEGIYGAYTIGGNAVTDETDVTAPPAGPALRDEALYLAQLVATLSPNSAEALGLWALLLFCEARRPAQFDAEGRFVPLLQQDVRHWQRPLLMQAERALLAAAALRSPGPLQLEAAIQSAHCQRAFTGSVPWPAIARLYDALVHLAPSVGAQVGRAVAQAEAGNPVAGLTALNAIDAERATDYQPYWVARAHLLRTLDRNDDAQAALTRAIGLTEDPRVRRHLQHQASTWIAGTSASSADAAARQERPGAAPRTTPPRQVP